MNTIIKSLNQNMTKYKTLQIISNPHSASTRNNASDKASPRTDDGGFL